MVSDLQADFISRNICSMIAFCMSEINTFWSETSGKGVIWQACEKELFSDNKD